jgi:SAM-dependent methyltransferase
MPTNIFTGSIAETYDAASIDMFSPAVLEPTVRFLTEAAGEGAALEFGIGTGRVALPLSRQGIEVQGIDISDDMIRQFRSKPGSESIVTVTGDFVTVTMPRKFSLVYLVFNVISNLTTQQEQVECFRNAARHLVRGGCVVVELWIPDLRRFPPGAVAIPFDVSSSHVAFDVLDLATQTGTSHHYFIDRHRVATVDSPYRYVWPSELDLMAQLAGLTLDERWSDWDRSPFAGESRKHVSVYR